MSTTRILAPALIIRLDRNQFPIIMNWLDAVCEQPTATIYVERKDGITSMGSKSLRINDKTKRVDYVYTSKINTDEISFEWNDSIAPSNIKLCLAFTGLKEAVKENNKKDQGSIHIQWVKTNEPITKIGQKFVMRLEKGDHTSSTHTSIEGVSEQWQNAEMVIPKASLIRIPNARLIELISSTSKKARDLEMTVVRDRDYSNVYGFILQNTQTTRHKIEARYNNESGTPVEPIFSFHVPLERIPGINAFLSVFKNGTTRIDCSDSAITFSSRFCSTGEQQMEFAKN